MTSTLLTIALLLAGVAPDKATAWMTPAKFGLSTGMSQAAARTAIERAGLEAGEGKDPGHVIVELDPRRTITLAFENERLQSIRFELVGFLPQIPKAFSEIESSLVAKLGEPTRRAAEPPVLMFDAARPAVYVVASVDPRTDAGKQGLGFLVVRYFEPPPAR